MVKTITSISTAEVIPDQDVQPLTSGANTEPEVLAANLFSKVPAKAMFSAEQSDEAQKNPQDIGPQDSLESLHETYLEYGPDNRLLHEIGEMDDYEFDDLKEYVALVAKGLIGIEKNYERTVSPQTYSAEKMMLNDKHVAYVTKLVRVLGSYETKSSPDIQPSINKPSNPGDVFPRSVEELGFIDADSILPLDKKTLRLAEVAAMLHDIQKNKAFKNDDERLLWHNYWSAETAREVLTYVGLKDTDIAIIEDAIVEHQPMPFVKSALQSALAGTAFVGAMKTLEEIPENLGQATFAQASISEAMKRGEYEGPSSEVAALVYCADLLSPRAAIDEDFLREGHKKGYKSLAEHLAAEGLEYNEELFAAGSFDRYVQINLEWGKTLMESIASAQQSLNDNVDELSAAPFVLASQSKIADESFEEKVRAATIQRIIALSFGREALTNVHMLKEQVSARLEVNQLDNAKLDMEQSAVEQKLDSYEDLVNKYRVLINPKLNDVRDPVIAEQAAELKKEIDSLKSAYIARSKRILYESAYAVYIEAPDNY